MLRNCIIVMCGSLCDVGCISAALPAQREHHSFTMESVCGSRKDEVQWVMIPGENECSTLQCFDTVGWMTDRTSGMWKRPAVCP